MRERIQVHVAALSLEESRKGIQQASSVARLTQLAFIFIPLTFTTGVSGMNVESLKNGAPLWKFWVTAATISLGAFMYLYGSHLSRGAQSSNLATHCAGARNKSCKVCDTVIHVQDYWRLMVLDTFLPGYIVPL